MTSRKLVQSTNETPYMGGVPRTPKTDYNEVARAIVAELKTLGRRTDAEIAERLGISRQAYSRRKDTNSLTTENITILSAWLVTGFGGGFYLGDLSAGSEPQLAHNRGNKDTNGDKPQ